MWLRSPLLSLISRRELGVLKAAKGKSGLLLRGWYHRGYLPAEGWLVVSVVANGRVVGRVLPTGRRHSSFMVPLRAGQYEIQYLGMGREGRSYPLHRQTLTVFDGHVWYVAFLPPRPKQRKPVLTGKWRHALLSEERIERLRPWMLFHAPLRADRQYPASLPD